MEFHGGKRIARILADYAERYRYSKYFLIPPWGARGLRPDFPLSTFHSPLSLPSFLHNQTFRFPLPTFQFYHLTLKEQLPSN